MVGPLVALALTLATASPASTPPAPAFPSTPAGRHAAAWFEAYAAGTPAMRAFFEAHVSAEGLGKRPVEVRLETYRRMRDDFGTLAPVEVGASEPGRLTVRARAGSGERVTVTFECEPAAPYALAGLRIAPEEAPVPEASGPPMSEAEVVAALRARVDSLAGADEFSGAVLLARGDRVLLEAARGHASLAERRPNTVATRFNLGSINKAFTRLAVEQLAAAGKLALGDTIARYLPDYPADKGRRITIEQLLEHRAGTGDIFNERYRSMDRSRLRSTADWMDLVRDQPLEFEPGARQAYSNAGYVLLGAIIEKVSGMSYDEYVRRHVFEPAGMAATASFARDEAVPDRAVGYTRHGAGRGMRNENTGLLPGRGSSAGGGYSTVGDLRRFADALRAGRLGVPPRREGLGIAGGSPGVNGVLEMVGDYTLVVLENIDPPAAEQLAATARGWLGRLSSATGEAAAGGAVRRVVRVAPGQEPTPHRMPEKDRRPRETVLPADAVEVPMERAGHLPVIEARVNGRGPFRFALDTGAAGTLRVDSALAASLGLAKVGEVRAGDPSGRNLRIMPLVAVDSISIGRAVFRGLTGAVRDYNEARLVPVDGILGFGLFAECLLTLDYPGNRLRLARGSLPEGAGTIPFRDERGIPQVDIDVAGTAVAADVDAGAMGGFSLPDTLIGRLPLAGPPTVVGRARTVSNTFEVRGATLKGTIRLGGQTFVDPEVTFQPLFPVANVGARVLDGYRITFDQKHRRMRLEKPA